MLTEQHTLAIYMEGALGEPDGKMGYGVLRYSPSSVSCVIDSTNAGRMVSDIIDCGRDCPVVADVADASALGANVLVLGIAPFGGRIPDSWLPALEHALDKGMNIVNGLHDFLADRFRQRLSPEQWIWDVRSMPGVPTMAQARAADLQNTRVLMIGTDMAIGKMTAGLELERCLRGRGVNSAFVATGQIGITICGSGIPLDAVKLDHAPGWIEMAVLEQADKDVVFIEGQGSLLHPASSATLPLMRGACPNRLILCHRAGMMTLQEHDIKIPPLKKFIELNEAVASAAGALTEAQTIGIALNTGHLNHEEALSEIARTEDETGLPVSDVVRFDADKLVDALEDSRAA